MKLEFPSLLLFLLLDPAFAFTGSCIQQASTQPATSALHVSIGLGPEQKSEEEQGEEKELVPGVDYEVPDHEAYRTSRRSKLDEQCDVWFGSLLGTEDDKGILGPLADNARKILMTPVPLVNDVSLKKQVENSWQFSRLCLLCYSIAVPVSKEPKPIGHDEWTPYVSTKLPWTPLTPAFGLEEFGLPVPRRNAETWRHFDVRGMVGQSYSDITQGNGKIPRLCDKAGCRRLHANTTVMLQAPR